MRQLIICSIIIAFWYGCTSGDNKQQVVKRLPGHESKVLAKLLQETTISQIHLDDSKVDSTILEEANLMAVPASPSSPVLGRAVGMVPVGKHFIIADRSQHAVLYMDKDGKLYDKFGRSGSGPGEYRYITSLNRNNTYIFVSDLKKAEVQIFTLDYTYVTSIIMENLRSASFSVDANNNMLFMPASPKDSSYLIQPRQAYPPWKKKPAFFPKLVLDGYQPAAYNEYYLTTNDKGTVVVSYPGLPYLFFYSPRLRHNRTVFLKTKQYEQLNNPPLVLKPYTNKPSGVGVSGLLAGLNIQDNGDVYCIIKHTVYRLSLVSDHYKLTGKFLFIHGGKSISIRQVLMYKGYLYLISSFNKYIYRVSLDRLKM